MNAPELNYSLVIVVTALMTAMISAQLGVWLVLRKNALVGDALSHAALPGVVMAYALGGGLNSGPALVGAAAFALLSVLLTEALASSRLLARDAALGLVFSGMFAAGVLAISLNFANVHLDLDAVLFGEIALVPLRTDALGWPEAWKKLGLLLLLTLGFLQLFHKELRASTFDAEHARLQGLNPNLVGLLLMALVALVVVSGFEVVGVVLMVALLTAPAAVGILLSRKLQHVQTIALGAAALACFVGHQAALFWDVSIGGSIALTLGIECLLAAIVHVLKRKISASFTGR